ncbi:MAG TPA: HutD family protein [Rubrivivax sp.]
MIEVRRLDGVQPQPWRNRGGVTRELLSWPPAAEWAVRISVADINQDGPFSSFPGIERWFAVLEGEGVVLRFASRREVLDTTSDPLHFDGAAAPDCELQGGATRDLNLMLRSGAGQGRMQRAAADQEWLSPAPWRALFCTGPARLQIDDTDAARLPAMALAWSAHAARQRWRLLHAAGSDEPTPCAFWMSFESRHE